MWLTSLVAAAAESTTPPANPPEIPYDQIGLVLVAIVGAVSAIIVAVVQRGNKTTPAPPAANAAHTGGFTVSEAEWIAVRDRVIALEAKFGLIHGDMSTHASASLDEHKIFHKDLDHIKRELGLT